MARRLVKSRLVLATLLVLPCSLLALRSWNSAGVTRIEEDLPLIPAAQFTREPKPTIVKPTDNWMDESTPPDSLAPSNSVREIATEPPEVPFLPPPLQTADERGTGRL